MVNYIGLLGYTTIFPTIDANKNSGTLKNPGNITIKQRLCMPIYFIDLHGCGYG